MIFKHVDIFAIVKETVLLGDTGKNWLRFKTECGLNFLEAWIFILMHSFWQIALKPLKGS